jgi:hypothetical protein
MKETALDAPLLGDGDDPLLGTVESPGRGQNAAVLAGVGIAEHDLLPLAGNRQQLPVHRLFQQQRQHVFDAV